MTEVHVSPNGADSGATLMAIVLIIAIAVVGLFAYKNGWFTSQPDKNTDINITVPTPSTSTTPSTTLGETSGTSY